MRMRSKLRLLTGAAFFGPSVAAMLSPALAQDATVLTPIVVDGVGSENPTAPVKGYVARSSATASKTGRALIETQQSVSIVTKDLITAQNAQTLGQALGYTPGVVSQPFGADPRFDSPSIRGFDGRQAQFLNGLRMMRTAGAPALEIYGLERVEVLRGPASVMYGQGNPGGLINMISKRPVFEAFGEVGIQAGSYDNYQTMFDIGGPVGERDDFAYRLTGLARDAGVQTDGLDNDRLFIAPALTWQPDDDTKLTILTSIQSDNPSTPSGLPPQLTLNATGYTLPRDFSVGDESFDRSDRTQNNFGYEFEHRFDETWTFRQNFRFSNLDWDYQALGMATAGLAPDGRTLRRNATYQSELLNTVNVDNNLQAEFSTGEIDHTLLFGLDYRYFDNKVETQFWSATPLNMFNPVYGGPIALTAKTLHTNVQSELSQVGVYVQDELAYDNWRATLALRQDWTSSEGGSKNEISGITRPLDQNDHKLTGRAGISYLFDGGIAPYVSYATSFEPVVGVDINNNPLKPTSGEQVEAGVKYQPEGWNGFLTAAVYDLKQENVSRTILGVPYQIGEVHVQGLELEGVASLAEGLDLRAAYTYMKSEIVAGTDDGNRVDNVPEHAASLWLNYTFQEGTALDGLGVGGGVRYVGQRYGNTTNTFNLEGVTLFDAALTYSKNGYKASLNIQNIADENYMASCTSFGCYYGDGRTVMGKLTYTW